MQFLKQLVDKFNTQLSPKTREQIFCGLGLLSHVFMCGVYIHYSYPSKGWQWHYISLATWYSIQIVQRAMLLFALFKKNLEDDFWQIFAFLDMLMAVTIMGFSSMQFFFGMLPAGNGFILFLNGGTLFFRLYVNLLPLKQSEELSRDYLLHKKRLYLIENIVLLFVFFQHTMLALNHTAGSRAINYFFWLLEHLLSLLLFFTARHRYQKDL